MGSPIFGIWGGGGGGENILASRDLGYFKI